MKIAHSLYGAGAGADAASGPAPLPIDLGAWPRQNFRQTEANLGKFDESHSGASGVPLKWMARAVIWQKVDRNLE